MAVLVSPAAPRRLRRRMAGLAVLAVMAGASGPALAQLDDYGGGYARYGYDYDDDYGPRYDYAPRRAAPIPPRAVGRIAAQEFGERVRVARHVAEAPEGRPLFNPARARNVGARAAGGEYLLFLDADVHVRPGLQEWIGENQDLATILAVGEAY